MKHKKGKSMKEALKRVIGTALFVAFASACSPTPDDLDQVLANRTAVILSGIESGDMIEVMALFAEDALYSPSGDTLFTDRAALTAYWDAVADSAAADAVLEVVTVERLAPDAFLEIQRYEVFDADGQRMFGGYASLLWRKVDGRWLIASDISNS